MCRRYRSKSRTHRAMPPIFHPDNCLWINCRARLQMVVGKSGRAAVFADNPSQPLMIDYTNLQGYWLLKQQSGIRQSRQRSTDIYDASYKPGWRKSRHGLWPFRDGKILAAFHIFACKNGYSKVFPSFQPWLSPHLGLWWLHRKYSLRAQTRLDKREKD